MHPSTEVVVGLASVIDFLAMELIDCSSSHIVDRNKLSFLRSSHVKKVIRDDEVIN